jgi:intracellular sulfur oxidation DsrE/DsrF family protein
MVMLLGRGAWFIYSIKTRDMKWNKRFKRYVLYTGLLIIKPVNVDITNLGDSNMKRTLTPLLTALLLATAPMTQASPMAEAAAPEAAAVEKVVYHVNDASVARVAMRNVENHINAAPDAKIVVVTHGKGIDFLLNDAKDDKGPFNAQVAGLKSRGVEFRVCRNTLKGRKLGDDAVIMEAQVVPSGVAEIGKLQSKEGYVYLKP